MFYGIELGDEERILMRGSSFVRVLVVVPSRWRFFSCGGVFLTCLGCM